VKKLIGCCLTSDSNVKKAVVDRDKKIKKEGTIMGIATEMKELTRNITSSHKDRIKKINEIREEANEARGEARSLLDSFEASREETNRQMRRDLAQDKAQRNSETRSMLKEAQDILEGCKVARKETSVQLRRDLSMETAEIRSEVYKLLGNAKRLVKNFQSSRKEGGGKLRRELAQSRARVESDVKQILSNFSKARGNVRADLKEARAMWQGLASTMQAKRDDAKTPLKAETPVVEEKARDLEGEMLAIVNENPEGISLIGVAEHLGVASVVLGRVSKSLVDKGEVRKDEKLYFPKVSQ
jgi:hypothetical protein